MAALLCVFAAAASHAQPAAIDFDRVSHTTSRSSTPPIPTGLEDPALRALWNEGRVLEQEDRFLAAARVYRELIRQTPHLPYGHWQLSRNFWRHAEALPTHAKEERLGYFERADQWAARGLEVDPRCAECMLWKFGAMGRIATTRGILTSLRYAPEMRDLLETAIALEPTYADDHDNTTLGNLYYASAVFYRVAPDWVWLQWLLGVRGDISRSLERIRAAVGTAPRRIDYNVELGAVLLCYSQREAEPGAAREGREVLTRAPSLPLRLNTDTTDLEHAAVLLREPAKACGYSRDGWIDMDEIDAQSATLRP